METEQKEKDSQRLQLILDLMRFRGQLHAVDAFLWLFIMGLPAVPGLIVREFFNILTADATLGWNVYSVLGLWIALVTVNVGVIFAGRHTKTQHRFAISALVRRNMLDALMQRPAAEPLQNRDGQITNVGEVISYLRDDGRQIEDQLQFLPELNGVGVFAVISFIILLTVNWQVTVFIFIPLLVIVGVVQWTWNRIQKLRQDGRQATQKVTGFIGEMFSTVQAIQVAGATESVLRHFRAANDLRRKTMVRDELFSAILGAVFRNIVTIGTGIMLLLLALRADLTLTVGDFALFVYFLGFIGEFLAFFGLFMAFIRQTDVAFDRLTSLAPERQPRFLTESKPMYFNTLLWQRVDLPPIEQPQRDPAKQLNLLEVNDLTYLHPDSGRGVKDANFTLRRGELLVITGAIGSGKTTLLRTLQGMLTPQSGTIRWNGQIV
ncbi:MAG: ABC transporter ATP-binding protein, partial [Chloroflexota bacterium]